MLTEWDGPVLCKHMVWCHQKMLKLLKQILSCSRNIKLFDSISEGAWKLSSYLFLIVCRCHVNKDDITIVMQHTWERAWSICSWAVKQVLKGDWYASTLAKLQFSNTNLKTHQPGTYEMKYESAQI